MIKNLYLPYYIVGSINSLKQSYLDPSASTVSFGCLVTNCTSRAFLNQLTSFPIFALCMSEYQWLYSPLTGIQPVGISLHCMYTFFGSLFNVALVVYLYCFPTHLDSHLFCLMPSASIKYQCEGLRKSLARIYLSMINLHEQAQASHSLINKANHLALADCRIDHPETNNQLNRGAQFERNRLAIFSTKYVNLGRHAQEYIEDCLTLFRSEWWHAHLNRSVCIGMVLLVSIFVIYVIGGLLLINHWLSGEADRLITLSAQLKSDDCDIRRHIDSGVPLTSSDIIRTTPHWNI